VGLLVEVALSKDDAPDEEALGEFRRTLFAAANAASAPAASPPPTRPGRPTCIIPLPRTVAGPLAWSFPAWPEHLKSESHARFATRPTRL
jgi:hypothetical protein